MTNGSGKVYLIGAGPGDPELITVKGMRILRAATAVVRDRLVADALLDEVSVGAAVFDVGKLPGSGGRTQADINALIVRLALEGHVVARLKGGDPFVFGRGGEEMLACRAAGVACEVVAGVSSALAGPTAMGVPVTHRGVGRSVAIVTARTDGCDWSGGLDYAALARMDTIVVLMGRGVLGAVVSGLVSAGLSAETPAACVERATMVDQREVFATLGTLLEAVERAELRAPVVTVISETAGVVRQLDSVVAAAVDSIL